jgi:hypothetical protein
MKSAGTAGRLQMLLRKNSGKHSLQDTHVNVSCNETFEKCSILFKAKVRAFKPKVNPCGPRIYTAGTKTN